MLSLATLMPTAYYKSLFHGGNLVHFPVCLEQYVPDSDKKRMADSREDVVDNADASLGS